MPSPPELAPDEILDFQKRFAVRSGRRRPDLLNFVQGEFAKAQAIGLIDAGVLLGNPDAPLETAVRAEINAAFIGGRFGTQGRWIAQCPSCAGAEYVDLGLLIFMCCSCFNAEHGHAWLRVQIPAPGLRQSIESELLKRPGANRNWLPDESLAALRHQNHEQGIG